MDTNKFNFRQKLQEIPTFLKNRYAFTAFFFVVWVLFFDSNTIWSQFKLQSQLNEKKAEKATRKANRLTQYKQARQKLLSAQDTIAKEQKKIKALDRAVIRRNAEPINKIKKDLADMAKKLKAAEKKLPV